MRLRTGLAGILAFGLALGGCSLDGQSGEPGQTESAQAPVSDATGNLKIWLMEDSAPKSVIQSANEAFAKTYPNVTVAVEIQKWAGIQDTLATAMDDPAPPDVVEIGNSLTARFAADEQLADLSPAAPSLGVPAMLPGLAESGMYTGLRYGIPFYGGVRVVVYNKAQFKAVGIDKLPKTQKQFASAAKKLAAAKSGVSNYSAFYFPGRFWYGAMPFVWMNSGEIADLAGGDWTGTLDSVEARTGLESLKKLVNTYSKAPNGADDTGNMEAFKTGNVGMMIDSWWVPGLLDAGKMKGNVGVFALPGLTSDQPAPSFIGGSDLVVPAKSTQQELATAYIGVLTGLPIQTKLAKKGGVIPNQEAAFAGHAGNKYLKVADAVALNSRFTPVSPNWGAVERSGMLPDMLMAILGDQQSVDSATTATSEALTETLNKSTN